MKYSYLIFILSVLVLASSCKHPIPGDLEDDFPIVLPPPFPFDSCDPDTVYFQQQILPLLSSNCAFSGCHDAESHEDGVVLDSYWNIINTGDIEPGDPYDSDLFEVIIENDPDDRMPPPPDYNALTSAQIALIQTWILQGALNNSCTGCDTTNVTFQNQISVVIANRCQNCHSGSNPDGDLLLTNYDQIKNEALYGSMYSAITHTGNVEPMPYNSAQLSECEIDLIRIWIENDAPLN